MYDRLAKEGGFFLYISYISVKLFLTGGILFLLGLLYFDYSNTVAYRIVAVFLLLIVFSNVAAKIVTQLVKQYEITFK